jgi:transposase-like protein
MFATPWLSFRCSRRSRDLEARMAERGIGLPSETIRLACRKFGPIVWKSTFGASQEALVMLNTIVPPAHRRG